MHRFDLRARRRWSKHQCKIGDSCGGKFGCIVLQAGTKGPKGIITNKATNKSRKWVNTSAGATTNEMKLSLTWTVSEVKRSRNQSTSFVGHAAQTCLGSANGARALSLCDCFNIGQKARLKPRPAQAEYTRAPHESRFARVRSPCPCRTRRAMMAPMGEMRGSLG
jgi:hypothetical protein